MELWKIGKNLNQYLKISMKIIDYLNKNVPTSRVWFLFTLVYTLILFFDTHRKWELIFLWVIVWILYYIFFYKEDKWK